MRPTLYLGIDPGLGGAIGWFLDREHLGVRDTPVAVVKASRRDYLVAEMGQMLQTIVFGLCADMAGDVQAAIEMGRGMPGQSSATTWAQARGSGLWEGLLAALRIPYQVVDPNRWKRAVGLPPGSDKGESRVLAARLFPELASSFLRVKDDGRADAMLILEWRRRQG
jgi:crossover junction endodeoxyribonuclease RuvC